MEAVGPTEGLQQGTGAEVAMVGPADGVVEDPGIGPVVDGADSAVVVVGGQARTKVRQMDPEQWDPDNMEDEPKRDQLWRMLGVH
jgi:hypothetical protein